MTILKARPFDQEQQVGFSSLSQQKHVREANLVSGTYKAGASRKFLANVHCIFYTSKHGVVINEIAVLEFDFLTIEAIANLLVQ